MKALTPSCPYAAPTVANASTMLNSEEPHYYDANGRLVPNSVLTGWRKKGDLLASEERTATNQAGNTYIYELPFVTLDREADMRQAHAHFEKILQERS